MAAFDQAGMKTAELINSETLPQLKAIVDSLRADIREAVETLRSIVDRLDGATITNTIKLGEAKGEDIGKG
jgi:signal transduction histidine kinase